MQIFSWRCTGFKKKASWILTVVNKWIISWIKKNEVLFLTDCAHMICKFPFDRSNSFPFDWSNGNELTQYSAYKLYPFSPSFLIINLAGYLTNGWMIGSSFFRFFLVNIAEFLWVVRAGEIIWEMKIEEFPLMRLFLIISVMLQSLNLAIIAGTFINSSYSFVSIFISSLSSSKKKRRFCNIFVLATFKSCVS